MKAAVIHEFGDIDVLKYEDIETPKPKPGHILIKVLVFACGPDHTVWQRKSAKEKGETLSPSFLGSVLLYLEELGVPKERIRKESYG